MQPNIFPIIISITIITALLAALWRIGLRKLKSYNSPILGKIKVLQKYNGEKVLTTNSYIQGISTEKDSIKLSYWYCVAKQAGDFCKRVKDPEVLMLGLGANTIPNLISHLNPAAHQTIVEIDDYIIKACREFFNLDALPNYQLIQADAFKLLSRENAFVEKKFDVIIIDIFNGNPPYVDIKSNHPDFITSLLPYLKKDGMVIFNRPGHTESVRSDSQKLENYLSALFAKTKSFDIKDPRGFRNTVITAHMKRQKLS
ncbi:hypothetical protein A3A14_01230 [Candidatus Daviesbacteria bacterium RIFCSPLOWO2_01_FULL_43_38]|uniref:PABS domain-containing protein n=2 Tax=Candidatus Daviesiibacteriota TaxID=1752718 RepID=A0A1F5K2U1_9BACT|nr:MAG: hypothetical protein UV41_C0073G0005 [Candidatus Daviesbacteria bacterium GW2011_GWA2_42_7]OGE20114.1 MAG: hypothetical protein A2874_02915 [Candidatus Daviesbacteria bacterium RIFCSPHIGHO2_01_FULL_43_17]OGE35206.1 MAG: hypothetical protein A3E45_02895 [Candidatus Daviesbacteria bacterium RIFCSPHIGHO2_12_FULL_43_11]OGE63279.1 MAG: hypothetical protein A3A14_01230 [Candidatus Daviesbacteria bacterium RIFCSPLOWO2_01_FULL_43_38]OGE68943.1 MAG: hypothetical protein A3J21_02415 [Candidatus D